MVTDGQGDIFGGKMMDEEQNNQYDLEGTMYNVFSDILENSKDIDPKYAKVIDDHFWELV